MAAKSVVDTHTLLWFLAKNTRIGLNAKAIMQDPASELVLPATALGEAVWIVEQGRVPSLSTWDILAAIDADPRIEVYPLDRVVIEKSIDLTTINEMHDREIVATALVLADNGENVVLLTYDKNITASGLVSVVW
jgi:PIN domain nuclease of toxin-antitoxin system